VLGVCGAICLVALLVASAQITRPFHSLSSEVRATLALALDSVFAPDAAPTAQLPATDAATTATFVASATNAGRRAPGCRVRCGGGRAPCVLFEEVQQTLLVLWMVETRTSMIRSSDASRMQRDWPRAERIIKQ